MPPNTLTNQHEDMSTIRHPSPSDDEDEVIDPDDLCPICHLLLHRPVTPVCKHAACTSCMRYWANASQELAYTLVPLDEQPGDPAADVMEVKCPMCRQSSVVTVDVERENALMRMYPETYAERTDEESEALAAQQSGTEIITLYVGNRHNMLSDVGADGNQHEWEFFVRPSRTDMIMEVEIQLHPTFNPPVVVHRKPPYEISRLGWGTFCITAHLLLRRGWTWKCEGAETAPNGRENGMLTVEWPLSFDGPGQQGRWRLKVKRH